MKAVLTALLCVVAMAGGGAGPSVRALAAAEAPALVRTWPLWDGEETVEAYAQRVGLSPTKTLDLDGGVKLEMVLIPAGKFLMGTPRPEAVDEEAYHKKIVTGQALLAAGMGGLLVLLGVVVVQAIRKRQRPKFSLARLLAMTLAAGVAVLSGVHWRQSVENLEKARFEYANAKALDDLADDDEKPAHTVTISKPFYMSKFEVTQEQCVQVMGCEGSPFVSKDCPGAVSWEFALGFCQKLSELSSNILRLPSEAEWEYACRAGTRTNYYTGSIVADLSKAGWFNENKPHPVGKKAPNKFGLYDMHGNVSEWCNDWYSKTYYYQSPSIDPPGPNASSIELLDPEDRDTPYKVPSGIRVARGGSWSSFPAYCRSATRNWLPAIKIIDSGIRLVCDVKDVP